MRAGVRSHFVSAVVGGVVVAGALVALGVTGEDSPRTIVEQGPLSSDRSAGLTPHEIYARDAPGVVLVRAQAVEPAQDPFDLDPNGESGTSTGSGFLIDSAGHILTNEHVIEGADRRSGVTVQFESDVSRPARVIGEDRNNDLAVLEVDIGGLDVRPLALGDSTTVRVGDATLAIANPFGRDRTLTTGIVAALQRQIRAPSGFAIDNVIQTDAPLDPGNSGGPLLDALGRVIGINSQIAATGAGAAGSAGIAFAVPVNTARALLPRLETGSRLGRSYLGVSGVAARRPGGVVVRAANVGGAAAEAGLRRGDVIETIAGRSAASMGQLQAILAARMPGQAVRVQVQRAGRRRSFRVVLGSSPGQ